MRNLQSHTFSMMISFITLFAYQETDAALGTRQKTRLKRPNVNLGSDQRDFIDNSDPNEDGYRNENQNNRLIEYIRINAHPYRRPVRHRRDRLEVHIRASLYQVVDLDQRNNLATLSAYFDAWWTDFFITWNASEFDGITHTFVPLKWIWKPEFYLYHSIQGKTPDYDPGAMAEVHSDGKIRLFVPITSRSLCPINVKYFPYDQQNCTFLVRFV